MRVENTTRALALRLGVTALALAASPVLLLAGGPLRRQYLRHAYRSGTRGLVCKEEGWVRPAYFVATNSALRVLCLPSERLLGKIRHAGLPSRRHPTGDAAGDDVDGTR
ncbi:hypothetical protein ACH46N_15995 [Streptomyces pristinaespiralis]|uniref:Predicted protein n=2 Tax=Streptomyces pristinaespiralis TaxID=38300 RepID=D6XA17_STRE2|nr:hypothetical protein [Streptomyces pristinaespiralis]ALC22196.1 hypothetical protein SPRI_3890 [Streptomyces pristinaespiralis]EFH31337.1 predicted protein [Streptomyces pristinaespiralis ATCC 25486]QMU15167.1 hypothetical protein H3L99_17515 [Streptomyces pristinaespiralis]